MAPWPPTSPPAPPFLRVQDELLEEIFLRLPAADDLACACASCPTFRRVIADHAFLRRYRALHPPPLVGLIGDTFVPAQPPHPSAAAARAFADFDFSCSFLPYPDHRWDRCDIFDGRVLFDGVPATDERSYTSKFSLISGLCVTTRQYRRFSVRDLAVCDPVHRRCVVLPAIPGNLAALVCQPRVTCLETFLAPPAVDEEDPLSFRVMCLVDCRAELVLFVYSSSSGQWRAVSFDGWTALTPGSSHLLESRLSRRQYAHRCFYWHMNLYDKLLVLDTSRMEFSTVDLAPENRFGRFAIVEAAEGRLGMLNVGCDAEIQDLTIWLRYFTLRNKQWQLEKRMPFPIKLRAVFDMMVHAGRYLLIEGIEGTTTTEGRRNISYLSLEIETLQIELFNGPRECIWPIAFYAGFPPSLSAPTI